MRKLIKYLPCHEEVFRTLKDSHDIAATGTRSTGVRMLCPTRWIVHPDALASIIGNYEILLSTWEECVDLGKDTETKVRISCAQMKIFDFLFGTFLGEMILRHSDSLSRTLQSKVHQQLKANSC